MKGIDVSSFDKTVNWDKVKADSMDFAMIRLGFRGYASGSLNLDRYYKRNIKESRLAEIPRGVYFFSTAIDRGEAVAEADFVCKALAGQEPELPVAFDYEYITKNKKYRTAGLSKKARSDIAIAFLDRIRALGLVPMMYASESSFADQWDTPRILSSTGARVWLARYYQNTGEPHPVPPTGRAWDMWQYTSRGRVDGVAGLCDINVVKTPFWRDDAAPSTAFLYTVIKGDVPERIAARFGLTTAALVAANRQKYPSISTDFIRIGWRLIIPAQPEGRTVRVTSPIGLNVRESPDASARKLGALAYGDTARLIASAGGWGQIVYHGGSGYIALAYAKAI